jgi:outer membrane murein-binding lipoprotein Lpp
MPATLMGRAHVFERGDKIFLTTPLTLCSPTEQQIDEYAFASAVKSKAPNENIGWLQGKYVEAGRPNLNGAMWLSDELAIKSLTPMLMPVTVMHDPRTAVGVIADCKFVDEQSAARIDNVLAIWRHRFGPVWDEAASNINSGTMMESMECYAPWYTCSSCEQSYVKLPQGAEQASWCDHLRAGDSWRILRDVCFTGTGLIFGSRGGVGAYTEAHLDHFRDEIAEAHDRAHHDSTYRPTPRSASPMTLVQIEDTELATIRRERDEHKAKVETLSSDNRDLTAKVEKAEADKVAAETAKVAAETAKTQAEEQAAAATLKTTRMDKLGKGFMAKLGETSKKVLGELAAKASDTEWDDALKEREELAKVKRDDATDAPGTPPPAGGGPAPEGTAFSNEELASFMRSGAATTAGATGAPDGATSVRALAGAFRPKTSKS